MKKIAVWSMLGMLMLGLVLLVVSCGGRTATSEKEKAPETPAGQETVPAQSTETETPAAKTTVVGAAPNIPAQHSTAGCPVCHEQGVAGAPKWPADHAGRTEQECGTCHQAAK